MIIESKKTKQQQVVSSEEWGVVIKLGMKSLYRIVGTGESFLPTKNEKTIAPTEVMEFISESKQTKKTTKHK